MKTKPSIATLKAGMKNYEAAGKPKMAAHVGKRWKQRWRASPKFSTRLTRPTGPTMGNVAVNAVFFDANDRL